MDIFNSFTFRQELQVRWMDLDPLAHVNNSIYIQYFELGRGKYMSAASSTWDWHKNMFLIASITCDYKRELKLTDHNPAVWVRTLRFGAKSFELEYLICSEKQGETILHAQGRSTQVMFDMKERSTFQIPEWLRNEITAYEKSGSILL
ncbi:Thioesterase [Fulvivirga imtechensis AK7]|uniref:Thioesterase n=1 Tax=Fulvivirga imtechensis AK7 TaxID=1237149 RepID=L8JNW0_9BACT|nr:thioesterase family protein [Fulvivirga imtechensis]ELR69863.1 Thioesterase [Fulvivirga imtechensis AK7]